MSSPKRVALALGSGGARGYAHIGAIEVLEERGYEIVSIAGSSMGALVGGLHAAGTLSDYTDWVRTLSQLDVVRLLDPSLSAPGAIRAEKIMSRVSDLLGGAVIEDLPISFTAVATDLFARRAVWFQRGPVDVAIRASIAIPGFITPVVLNGRLLADGGMMEPVPIAPTSSAAADLTVAISLNGEHRGTAAGDAPARESTVERPMEEWSDRLRRGAAQLLDREMFRALANRFGSGHVERDDTPDTPAAPTRPASLAPEPPYGALPAGLGKFDVMNLSLEAMQTVLTRYRLAGYPPDVLVDVPKDAARSIEFHRAGELIELGRTLTAEALDVASLGDDAGDG